MFVAAHNQFVTVPAWLGECSKLNFCLFNNNVLEYLPESVLKIRTAIETGFIFTRTYMIFNPSWVSLTYKTEGMIIDLSIRLARWRRRRLIILMKAPGNKDAKLNDKTINWGPIHEVLLGINGDRNASKMIVRRICSCL